MIQDRDCGDENDVTKKFRLQDVITAADVRAWLRVNDAIEIYGEEAVCGEVVRYDLWLYEHLKQMFKE